MSKLAISDAIWAAWLVLFLVLELGLGLFGGVIDTLSATSAINEHLYPILQTILFGFLIGLAVHIRFETNFWKAAIGGMLIAIVLNFIWK